MALNNKKVNMKLQQTIEAILTDRPIAYHAVLAKAVGSATAGIFLSQLLYWTPRAHDKDGWIYKTQKDIYEETALTRWEQESARKVLRKAGSTPGRTGVLEEKRAGVPSRLYFRINMAAIVQLLGADLNKSSEDNEEPELVEPDQPTSEASHDVEKPHRTMWKNHILVSGNSTNKSVGIQQTFNETETTTESTTENDVARQALLNFGVSKSAATKLAKAYPETHIIDKLELAQWLISTGSPLVAKSPAGWLRKAIEEDYAPPKNYQSYPQQQAKREREAKTAQAEARERRMAEEEYRRVKAETKAQLLEQYLPQPIGEEGLTTESVWNLTLKRLKEQIPAAIYETWLKDTMLLQVSDRAARIAVPSAFAVAWLERRLYLEISHTLRDVLQYDVDLQFVTSPLIASA